MHYLYLTSAAFLALSLYRPHRKAWLALCALSITTALNREYYAHTDWQLYAIRAGATLAVGIYLLSKWSAIRFYHAIVLSCTLMAYAALEFDVSQGRHVLIYNNYEAVIYGLVTLQLLGTVPTIWAISVDLLTRRVTNRKFNTGALVP